YTKFCMPQLASVTVMISLILNLSSTLGPTIGGFLTDTFSWHWLFLVNIVPGILVAAVVWVTIDIDRPNLSMLRYFDFAGLVLMAVFLGCLEYALEEGPRWDWLSDNTILTAVIVSVVASVLFFWRVLTYHQPIVDLRAFLNRNFALGSFYTFIVGTGLYGATYVIPLDLAAISTVLNTRLHFHWNRLIENINPARPAVQQFLDAQANRLEGVVSGDSSRAAFKLLAQLVQREALVLTYNDVLMLLGVAF